MGVNTHGCKCIAFEMDFSISTTEGMHLHTNLDSFTYCVALRMTPKYLQTTNKKYSIQLNIYGLTEVIEDWDQK